MPVASHAVVHRPLKLSPAKSGSIHPTILPLSPFHSGGFLRGFLPSHRAAEKRPKGKKRPAEEGFPPPDKGRLHIVWVGGGPAHLGVDFSKTGSFHDPNPNRGRVTSGMPDGRPPPEASLDPFSASPTGSDRSARQTLAPQPSPGRNHPPRHAPPTS